MSDQKPIHMQFYDAPFMDFDWDHQGYTDAMMALTVHGREPQISRGKAFLQKYADQPNHKHSQLCRDCLDHLAKVRP